MIVLGQTYAVECPKKINNINFGIFLSRKSLTRVSFLYFCLVENVFYVLFMHRPPQIVVIQFSKCRSVSTSGMFRKLEMSYCRVGNHIYRVGPHLCSRACDSTSGVQA